MRRITLWIVGTISGLVLLLSYRTSTMGAADLTAAQPTADTGTTATTPSPAPSSSASAPSSSAPSTSAPSSSSSASPSTSSASQQFTGQSDDTRWGPVQVLITVTSGKITKAEAVEYPQNNGRDLEINARALPVLAQEVVAAQSAQIDTVSGATVTSDGYLTSLQSAIDAAHLDS